MSVVLETSLGNVVIDVFEKQPKLAYTFLKQCKVDGYFFARLEVEVDVAVTAECAVDVEVPAHLQEVTLDNDRNPVGLVTATPKGFSISLGRLPDASRAFGLVAEGFAVLEAINKHEARILHTHVLHDPYDDLPSLANIPKPTYPTDSQLEGFSLPEQLEDSTYQALVLELMGDISHHNVKPSPQTLFVAKLNPITTSDALEIVFGRFGTVTSAHIVKDSEGKSKGYGFVEYSTKEEANKAYAKLQSCVIDGRQVVVDFSQSTRLQ